LRRPRAVTFDFWSTLFVTGDLDGVRARRLAPWLKAPETEVRQAVADGFALHNAAWRVGRDWGGARGLADLLLQRFPARAGERAELIDLIEVSGIGGGERPVEGALAIVRELSRAGLRLGVVSDTGFTPGRVLPGFLSQAGLLDHFEPAALAFSNEVGVPKPDPRMFRAALAGLGVGPSAAVHVGDLRRTDVAGARAAGMGTVRFAGDNPDGGDGPEADAVITSLFELPVALGLD
jgi:putative hydrolase of the HAD superfamily